MTTKSTFGQLLKQASPLVVVFYANTPQLSTDYPGFHEELRDLAVRLYDKNCVIKINMDHNEELVHALRIKHNPTFMIYDDEKIIYRRDDYTLPEELLTKLSSLS